MVNLRKILNLAIIFSLVFSMVFRPSAKAADIGSLTENLFKNVKEHEELIEYTQEVPVLEADKFDAKSSIKTLTASLKKIVKKDDQNIVVTIEGEREVLNKDMEVEKEQVKEEIRFTKNGEVYINNVQVPEEILNYEVTLEDFEPKNVVNLESGGVSWLTHYNEFMTRSYTLKSYKDAGPFLDPGSQVGPPRVKYANYDYRVVDFKNLAHMVATARGNIDAAAPSLMVAIGVTAISWWNVLALIPALGSVGVAAWVIYINTMDGKKYIKQAYDFLGARF